ncbi:MAG: BBP7 family outer membrane beta-barrel protein, partial [Aureliella sp.]
NQQQYAQQHQQPASPYRMVAVQDPGAIYGQSALETVPAPAPMAQPMVQNLAAPGCQTQPVQQYQAPVDYGYQQMVAPNASYYGPSQVGSSGANYSGGNAYAGNNQFFGAPTGVGLGGGGLGGGLPCGAKPWFFGASALIFQRADNHNVPLTLSGTDYSTDLLTSQSASMPVSGGFEASVGRYFNCGKNAVQASYWGLYPTEQTATVTGMPGELSTRIPFGFMQMPDTPAIPPNPAIPGTPYPVVNWFNNAHAHQLVRSSTYQNVEVNLLGFAMGGAARSFNMSTAGSLFSGTHGAGRSGGSCGYCGDAGCGACGGGSNRYATGPCGLTAPTCGSRCNVMWLGGFRYFHFSDNLQYGASLNDTLVNGGADDLYYNVDTTNDLFGFQLGSQANYCLGRRVNLYGTGKVGVYNNHSRLLTRLGTDAQNATLNDTRTPANPNNGGDYDFDVSTNNIAFLSEIGTGVGVRLSPKWTGTVGYRAIIVSGVATSPDNIRSTFANFNDVVDYDTTSCLILHGLNVGALYNF